MPSQDEPRSTEDHLSVIDSLTALPFPDAERRLRNGDWSGPGYHFVTLLRSQDFWDDRSEETVEAAETAVEAERAAVAAELTGRWGEQETVGLWPYLAVDDRDHETPGPLGLLSNLAGSMQVWRPVPGDRWLALAVGQADPEWPLQLLAAVGEASSLTR
ncbi:hypothetical protein OG883_37180 [Streptomyces sp. NBC_01142]|uniref:hypothetical protein n=1 Tax=Streptomyces sp. NBC_01142 TaxID=2975865 RepID=UPI002257A385|nr:hypothetical protein [Streptomyces sp. NBC_01142]MCX4825391.1 hypothetical protein [Streptomyces sp. NBC_01142]